MKPLNKSDKQLREDARASRIKELNAPEYTKARLIGLCNRYYPYIKVDESMKKDKIVELIVNKEIPNPYADNPPIVEEKIPSNVNVEPTNGDDDEKVKSEKTE